MTFKRLLGIAMALCAVAVLTGSVGAGAARTPAKRAIDLSTNTSVRDYLRSHGISPRGVAIQRGVRNYAGPSCPGKGWACTHAKRVVQIATGRGRNMFRCLKAKRCLVVQLTKSSLAATNIATCIKTTGITQSCSITQSGAGGNEARVYMNAKKLSGLTQNATQTATIAQTTGSGANTACVSQIADIESTTTAKRGTPVSVTLDAHQSISVSQNSQSGSNTLANATNTGGCGSSPLKQSQLIVSKANGAMDITQNENTLGSGANMFVDVAQNSTSGANTANFDQTNTLAAIAVSQGPVNQTQSTVDGGIDARVNQFSHGVSKTTVNQTETQCVHARTSGIVTYQPPACPTGGTQPAAGLLNQVQHGPVRKGTCCSTQADNDDNEFDIFQTSTQDSDGGSVEQTNTVEAECSTSGDCMATQTATVDGQSTTNTQSGESVSTGITCNESNCTQTAPPPPTNASFFESGHQLTASNVDVNEFGAGGMRDGAGTGSIAVSGVTGTVAKAVLYWHGPTNSTNPAANANVTFNGTPVTGTNIGFADDNNWGFQNSQSYKADVTGLVTGNDATYSLSGFVKPDANINGVALIVFYDDGNTSNNRNVYLWSGNDSNLASTFDPANWDETISGVSYPGGGATMDFVVGDGQTFTDGALVVNGTTVAPAGQIFDGDTGPNYSDNPEGVTGSLWDVESFDITSALTNGTQNVHLTSAAGGDALSLVVAAVNVPVSAPVILGPAVPAQQSATGQAKAAPSTVAPRVASGGRGSTR
jgi:hypothetical protein